MTAKPKSTKKAQNRRPPAIDRSVPRRLKRPTYRSFRLGKRVRQLDQKPPSSLAILRQSLAILRQHWKLVGSLTLIYGLLTILLVRGFGGGLNLGELKTTLQDGFDGQYASLATGAALFSYLLGSAGSSATPTGGVYQTLLVIIMSLVIIWTLRQILAGKNVGVKDGFYKGMYPLVPFVLVLLVISLQLLPFAIGSWLYTTVVGNGIAVTAIEKLVWALLFFLLALLSLYMVCSSVFALYISTLPDMTPMRALRSARQLVLHRRSVVFRKVLFLPVVLLLLGAVIMIPLILFVTPVAEWIFFLLSMFVLVVVHAYMYTLYRKLL